MNKIAIVTDSNSGISQEKAKEMGIYVLPMPFLIDGKEYLDGVDLFPKEFYEYLEKDADVSTSQPSPESVMGLWDKLLKEYDEIVHIPMSSGLSGSCQTARMLAEDYDGKVEVVNNQRISITQVSSVLDAQNMVKAGMSAAGIRERLEEEGLKSSIYITLTTLKYLKKRRKDYAGGSGSWHDAAPKAGSADPGGEAGRLFQGPDHERSKTGDAGRDSERSGETL